jgi:uncharacterized protein (TIGR03000 family)
MYSLLFMTAMAGGGDAPAFGGRLLGGCHGCQGAVVAYSCFGSSCNGCWGSSCHGSSCYGSSCQGSSCHGTGFLGLRNRLNSRAAGCYGSCHGCWGSSCHGCWGSSCHGSSCHGCVGSIGGSVSYYEGSVVVMPAVGTAKIEQDDEKNQSASLIVELPAGAKLFVDGQLIPGDATARRFHTPVLVRGKTYYYDMKAELTVAGKPVVEERKVMVMAGQTVRETFGKLAGVATGEDTFVVR